MPLEDSTLEVLCAVVAHLGDVEGSKEDTTLALKTVAESIAKPDTALSSFGLLNSGLVAALLELLRWVRRSVSLLVIITFVAQ